MLIEDNRLSTTIISPCKQMVPDGATNFLYDIVGKDGKVGEIEVGTDGFIQIRLTNEHGHAWANLYHKLTWVRFGGGIYI